MYTYNIYIHTIKREKQIEKYYLLPFTYLSKTIRIHNEIKSRGYVINLQKYNKQYTRIYLYP